MNKGDKVTVERDETKYPAKGTWKQFRGKTGVITAVIRGVGDTEYGVSFSKDMHSDAYFKRYELTVRK
ncbi:hypothetical protein PBI_EQUEMIOH13_53 [Mycobacterium phage Equemioh13]|uniref:Uncharacterized protein n=2 Tax=Turbidovirus TaxID=2948936 RepID=A0A076YHL8_9CAUD|nr:hypothetical protein AVV38_gp51 [Mycobacterium phage Piro94]YP_009203322.1 hypothetical protein AVT12_gp53 [Mycobacterium phage Equemioh13]YP_010063668.1 hypothetical protein KIY82_gp54 [Mycobacterium phage Centaur]AMB18542.1 hypothetical protein NASIATALIE_52 [Mycobacterium phage NaSiaTalie]AOZ63995.1 hypothetical protein SEA_BAEHEXIC_51 [Mycobacterium phage Baehexic]ASZ72843.1 hypothetical protein SEA_DRAKE55_54 [Mycobacterium phage Drake55]ATN92290.1 hypothetical protein SEA_UPDAWG_53 [